MCHFLPAYLKGKTNYLNKQAEAAACSRAKSCLNTEAGEEPRKKAVPCAVGGGVATAYLLALLATPCTCQHQARAALYLARLASISSRQHAQATDLAAAGFEKCHLLPSLKSNSPLACQREGCSSMCISSRQMA